MNAPSGVLLRPFLIAFPAAGLALGFAVAAIGHGAWSGPIWAACAAPVLLVLIVQIITSLRRGDVGLDVVAALSMTAALMFGEYLAAAVVALMYAGGQYLESFAEGRARREMTALLSRTPRTALRHSNNVLEEIDLDLIESGDRLLVRRGDVVPVDGAVGSGVAVLDQSALTGESVPVQQLPGAAVMSGSTNVGDAFDLIASRRAAESTYAGIVRLVEAAQRSKAPMSRLADRLAIVFLGLTVAIAGAAWLWTGDPIRAVAVLVVATPCPLILAVPVAIISGLSRAAKHGVLIKGGKVLESLARIRSVVIDKTGTLTDGRAKVVSVRSAPGISPDDLVRIAASLDQASKHIIAQAIVSEAHHRKLDLAVPANVVETPGEGVEGTVEGRATIVGGIHFVASRLAARAPNVERDASLPGTIVVAVAIDGMPAGMILLADTIRSGTVALLEALRRLGIERIVLATGDRREVAEAVTAGLPFSAVRSDLTPDQKVLVGQIGRASCRERV